MRLFKSFLALLAAGLLLGEHRASAADPNNAPPKTPEDMQREAAIAEFAKKQEAANWPEKFQRIGDEMGVPGDVLAAVAFAETRWDHLQWPPGETASSENGMPRPFGIMSLWDNEHFGHSLLEAAQLINKSPEELKQDPELNIRGAAALLKKLYDENPKPDGTTAQDIESWRYAIVKYCGIPERDLANGHAVDCYISMNQGYDQYGMHWKPRPVNLAPMKAELKKIKEEEEAKRNAAMTPAQMEGATPRQREAKAPVATAPSAQSSAPKTESAPAKESSPLWIALVIVIMGGGVFVMARSKKQPAAKK